MATDIPYSLVAVLYMVKSGFRLLVEGNKVGNIVAKVEVTPPLIIRQEQVNAYTSFLNFLTKNKPIKPVK